MSRQTNKTDAELKALLNRKHTAPADDFEKEALEGFALLENNQEAFELKAKLDGRMNEVLEEKKSRPVLYWMAAAGLLLVVGFSAYFLLANDPAKKNRPGELAITEFKPAPPPLAEEKKDKAAFKEAPPQTLQPEQAEGKKQSPPPAPSAKGYGFSATAAANQNQSADLALAASEAGPAKNTMEAAPLPVTTVDANQEDMAMNDKLEKAKTEEQETDREKTVTKKSSSRKESASPTAPAPDGRLSNGMSSGSATGNCYYEGGNELLQKELTERLLSKELDRHFEATVYVQANTRIGRVEFAKPNKLSEYEQNEITYVLQSLDKFRFVKRPAREEVCEYKITR